MPKLPVIPYITQTVPDQLMTYDASCIGGTYAQGESQATEVRDVGNVNSPQDLTTFIMDCLGWSTAAGDGAGGINRRLPAQHPSGFALYASRITNVQGIAPTGQVYNVNNFDATFKCYRVTIQYETPMYQILANGDAAGNEWKRYVIWNFEPTVEFIQRQNTSFYYDSATPDLQASNKAITGNYGQTLRLVKKKITATWVQVPDNGLFPGGSQANLGCPNQDSLMGKVNNATIFGNYKPGTLRFDGYRLTPRVMPITLGVVNTNKFNTTIPLSWDVQFNFTYFEPTAGNTPSGTGIDYGHNLVPHPSQDTWWPAWLGSSTNVGASRYEVDDFSFIFKLNS